MQLICYPDRSCRFCLTLVEIDWLSEAKVPFLSNALPGAGLKCWAFSPPGGLVSETLLPALREWCISVVCGKDAVPRMTTNTLARLMDEMVTALARARYCHVSPCYPQHWDFLGRMQSSRHMGFACRASSQLVTGGVSSQRVLRLV